MQPNTSQNVLVKHTPFLQPLLTVVLLVPHQAVRIVSTEVYHLVISVRQGTSWTLLLVSKALLVTQSHFKKDVIYVEENKGKAIHEYWLLHALARAL